MKQLLTLAFLCISHLSQAQSKESIRIVWDMSATDTAEHSAIFRQINNVLTAAPDARIEVVFHGQAVWVMTKDSSKHAAKVEKELARGVTLVVCNNSMRRLKVDPSQLLPGIVIVPVAMLELARKQQEGWSYIKAGH